MDVSITDFKNQCLDLLRNLNPHGKPLRVTRHGKVIAKVIAVAPAEKSQKPWMLLRGKGRLRQAPGGSVLKNSDFEALR